MPHFTNFADAIREGKALNQTIADGQVSSMLCHLGNMAFRTDGALDLDPATGKLIGNPDAQKLWTREAYREGWEL